MIRTPHPRAVGTRPTWRTPGSVTGYDTIKCQTSAEGRPPVARKNLRPAAPSLRRLPKARRAAEWRPPVAPTLEPARNQRQVRPCYCMPPPTARHAARLLTSDSTE